MCVLDSMHDRTVVAYPRIPTIPGHVWFSPIRQILFASRTKRRKLFQGGWIYSRIPGCQNLVVTMGIPWDIRAPNLVVFGLLEYVPGTKPGCFGHTWVYPGTKHGCSGHTRVRIQVSNMAVVVILG